MIAMGDAKVVESSPGEAAVAAMEVEVDGEKRGEVEKMMNGGNRWPRQETLALLKIRSDMDAVFRDSTLKGPLWDEVSRKLAELGYKRSSKKCKEKFENVYKYHKRTKEGKSGKREGKTYRFFDQLQAFENQFSILPSHLPKPQPSTNTFPLTFATTTVPSTTTITNPTVVSPSPPQPPSNQNHMNLFSSTTSTSSSTASDEDLEEKYRKKRKWKDYFRRLTRQVLAKQEEMQKRFLEGIEKRDKEHVAQQDAWRMQEMARINREHDILVQERSSAAAKNAAVIAFLQKLSTSNNNNQLPQQAPAPAPAPALALVVQPLPMVNKNIEFHQNEKVNNGEIQIQSSGSSSRWPKTEVHELIRLRTSMESKYQENGPKAPLWEDISAGMQRLGYNRSAKRCKEKWENINKYFKKVKESNKHRREDSKTCPYFNELDALYKEKSKNQNPLWNNDVKVNEMMEPLMVQPEQQWRPPSEEKDMNNHGSETIEDEEEVAGASGEEEDDDDDDEEEGNSRYEIGTNKLSSMDIVE